MTNYITEYYNLIESGEIVTSQRVKKQYQKLNQVIIEGHDKYYYDEAKALKPINFIENFCRHSKGEKAGQLLELELFQKAYISALFGFINKETGYRQYKETMLLVSRKNGKSTLLSAIALYMLLADGEKGAEVYSIATKKDQAKLVFDEAYRMIQQDSYLSKVTNKRRTDIYCDLTFSKFQPLASDSNTLDGLNSHLVVIDELHGITDRTVYEVMKQSISSRKQPMIVMITTAGTVRENIFDDMYNYATKVVDGAFEDDTFLPILYELDDLEEYADSANWSKANPALGTIKDLEYLSNQLERAKNNPADLQGILVKDFNVRGTDCNSWLTFTQIDNSQTFDLSSFQDYFAMGGADLSKNRDLTAGTVVILDPRTENRYVQQHYWIPRDSLAVRTIEERTLYNKWNERGLITFIEGNIIDYSYITAWFIDLRDKHGLKIPYIYYDSWSATQWVKEMEYNGFKMIATQQGYKTLSLPMQTLGADLVAKRVNYNNNPILKWCLTNTHVKPDINGNIQPIKSTKPSQRIDGTASLLDAYVGLLDNYDDLIEANKIA